MAASTHNHISGNVQIIITLADDAGVEALPLVELITTWIHAVAVGLFGPGMINRQQAVEAQGQRVSGKLQCEQISQTAFHALSRMIKHFSKVKGPVESYKIFLEGGRDLASESGVAIPSLPQSIPFDVEYPNDLHADVRVEIEFSVALPEAERDSVFAALSSWTALVEAFGEPELWNEGVEYETRLFSPAIVEHEVFGYFAGFECLNFIVLLGLRLHERLHIDRITFE